MSTYRTADEFTKLNRKFDERAKKDDEKHQELMSVLGRIATALEAIAEPEILHNKDKAAKLPKPRGA